MNVYLNPCPSTPGHFCMRDENNERVDSFSGPRDFIISVYLASGNIVHDEQGKRITR